MKSKIKNQKSKISKAPIFFIGIIAFIIASPVLAQGTGLVPCSGIDCTLCDLFKLVQNIFNFVIQTIVPAIAVIGIAWGGYVLLTSGGSEDRVKTGRKILLNTVIGFVIAYASFIIASSIVGFLAPGDARFSFSGGKFAIQCTSQPPAVAPATRTFLETGELEITILGETEDDFVRTQPAPTLVRPPASGNIRSGYGVRVDAATLTKLNSAADALARQNYALQLVSGYRTSDDQRALIRDNCQNPPGSSAGCNPKPGKPNTCILKNGPNSCPHTSGRAVDVWGVYKTGSRAGQQCITQETCLSNKTACANNPCQRAVINAMRNAGFCKLASEPWHFEYPWMSSSCR